MRERMIDSYDHELYQSLHPDDDQRPKYNYRKVRQERQERIEGIKKAKEFAARLQQQRDDGGQWMLRRRHNSDEAHDARRGPSVGRNLAGIMKRQL